MDNEKMEAALNLARSEPESLREKSDILDAGYDQEQDSWEVIIKYNGDLAQDLPRGIELEPLIAGYGILTIPASLFENVPPSPWIEYAELPKRLYFEQGLSGEEAAEGYSPSDFLRSFSFSEKGTAEGLSSLSGEGVLVAVIDSGIDYTLPNFRHKNGSTRIAALWDQTLTPDAQNPPPEGFRQGKLYTSGDINAALQRPFPQEILPSVDTSGHGTAVAGIAASGAVGGEYAGMAPESDLLIVKLGNPSDRGFPRTTELMRALTFAARFALERNQPLSVNLSFGNSYGSHNGTSLLERFIDNVAEIGRNVICVGTGNEGLSGGHYSGRLTEGMTTVVEISVAPYEASLSIQLWKNYVDDYAIWLIAPDGGTVFLGPEQYGKVESRLGRTRVLGFFGQPTPYSTSQEIFFDLLPEDYYIDEGVWRIRIEPAAIRNGYFYLYLPVASTRNQGTRFMNPSQEMTLTIPSTAAKTIAVSAYHPGFDTFADFSGRGAAFWDHFQERSNIGAVRPTLSAPGTDILAPMPQGGYGRFKGTSFAAPFVAGAAALLMEWGILRGHDYFLYGEKLKAGLIRAAKPLPGVEEYPSSKTGYGRLSLKEAAFEG
ncbi:MAG: S8 family serine peptidase [Lachnospiraceae bacterium]|nr:S8 family serine peptidase [Lachnospiraceae bacterium]